MLAASDDVETQRRGICSIVLPDAKKECANINMSRIVFMKGVYSSLPIRTASIHFCLPNTRYSNLMRTVFILTMPSFRKRMKFHIGKHGCCSVVFDGFKKIVLRYFAPLQQPTLCDISF